MSTPPPLPLDRSRIEILPDRAAWLAARTSQEYRIGGSDVARILDRSPYGGPWEFWMSRRRPSPLTAQPAETPEQRRGKRQEARVLEDYAHDFHVQTWMPRDFFGSGPESEIVIHGPEWWQCSTPDAFGHCALTGTWGMPEAKTSADPDAWGESQEITRWTDDDARVLPPHYALQGFWYLACTGLPWVDICALIISQANAGLLVRRYRLHAQPVLQEHLIDTIGEWRQRHLVEGEPPPVTAEGACRDFLGTRFGASDRFREPNPYEENLMTEYLRLHAGIKQATERKKHIENLLLESMGEAGGLCIPGRRKNNGKPQVLRRVYVSAHEVKPYTIAGRHQPAQAYLKVPRE